jgi:phosphoribosylformylglycinamidine (FGAM) synthase PurS component
MRFLAEIDIMPLKEILDLEAVNETEAEEKVNTACRKLLANLIMESYQYKINVLA